ncbi:hypothetical protein CGCSCA4_v005337 [Colletotrichum siamense]|uniref:Uncharacterized protein n=1 Tax=Colletotrichum siamense TaxID=690259 RepID=A0A9P5EXG7_COLSI|nr:hypothetical protein CGCSCA4_v005337 [Colletotrichum siamense]KAF4861280.1 hypothetical protein CGCSCA2_v004799 [Colletotrichum siamense]
MHVAHGEVVQDSMALSTPASDYSSGILPAPCADHFSFGPDWDIGTLDFSFIQAQFELGDANMITGDVSDGCQDSLVSLVSESKNVALSDIWEPKSDEHNEMERQNLAVGEGAFGVSHSKKATGTRDDIGVQVSGDYWEATHIYDFVHLPTLDLCKQAPELLGALIAIGALQAESIVARKFGYAMQEVVRASAFDSWEGNNAARKLVRKLLKF